MASARAVDDATLRNTIQTKLEQSGEYERCVTVSAHPLVRRPRRICLSSSHS